MSLQAVKGGWVYKSKTVVNNWCFWDGVTPVNPGNPFGEVTPERSWTCWVFPDNNHEFESWMATNCPGADVTFRFNSGNPMYTVTITDDQEAMLFQLKWV